MLTDDDWDIPKSLEEAEKRRLALIAEIQEIQTQMGDRIRRRDSEFEEYWTWRRSAHWAMVNRLQELRLIKDWMRKESFQMNQKENHHGNESSGS